MKLTQIATLLNDVMVPNLLGDDTTIAEDLRNVVDLGTAIANLTADDLKDYMKAFALGVVRTYVDTKLYKNETFGLFIDSIEYGGAVQRVKARLLEAVDTPILTLENGEDYGDFEYHATEFDSKIYTKDVAYQVIYSIPVEMFKKSFISAEGVRKLVALIESNVENTLTVELNALAKSILRKIIVECNTGRKINLITTYNTAFGYTSTDDGYITLQNWKHDTSFKLWCEELVIQLKKYITDYNAKYNDGTINVFSNEEDTKVILLTEFATALDFAQSSVYHKELTSVGTYSTINFWQNSSDSLVPQISATSVHDEVKEITSGTDTATTVSHVVGLVMDRNGAGITNKLNKVTTQYVPKGDFNTFFHHMSNSYWIDTRDTAVILCLA